VTVLHTADTHLGYGHRPDDDAAPWRGDVDVGARFDAVVDRAVDLEVDAVVHAGDAFDDRVDAADLRRAADGLARLAADGIPFYYVVGNHDSPAGLELLDAFEGAGAARRLDADPVVVDGVLALYGLDYYRPGPPAAVPDFASAPADAVALLVAHATPAPLGVRENWADLALFRERSAVAFDAVALGHWHVPVEHDYGEWRAFYAGAPARIAPSDRDNRPGAWTLRVADGELSPRRHHLDAGTD